MILTITSQKGGIGKSTLSQTISASYASQYGYNTLMIDFDPQANLTTASGIDATIPGVYDVLMGRVKPSEGVHKVSDKLDILPGSSDLSHISEDIRKTGSEYRLKEAIEPILGQYQRIVIDTPPTLGLQTIMALTASHKVLIPAQTDIFSLTAIRELSETIEVVKKYTNPQLEVEGIVLTRYQSRRKITQVINQWIKEASEELHTKVYPTPIREAVAVPEAQAFRQDIFTYCKEQRIKPSVLKDYTALMEILEGKK